MAKQTEAEHKEVIKTAVMAFFVDQDVIFANRDSTEQAQGGQLDAVRSALKDYDEPITEQMWDKVYKAEVAYLFQKKYQNEGSRAVMLTNMKRATMGLTLGKHDPLFAPSSDAENNLKKYADEVAKKLQAAGLLRKNAGRVKKTEPEALPDNSFYFLIGCVKEGDDIGAVLRGPNKVIGDARSLDPIKEEAARVSRNPSSPWKQFMVCTGAVQPLAVEHLDEKPVDGLAFSNSAVFSANISSDQ